LFRPPLTPPNSGGEINTPSIELKIRKNMKKKIIELAVKVIVAALTAFLTAITTTSCLGQGPF
jgi:hypothetical protein